MKQKIIIPSGVNSGSRNPILKQALSGGNANPSVRASSYGRQNQAVSGPRVVVPPRKSPNLAPVAEPRNTGRSSSMASKYANTDRRRSKAEGGSKMWLIPVIIGVVLVFFIIVIAASSGPKHPKVNYEAQVQSISSSSGNEKYAGPDFSKKAGSMRDYMNQHETPEELAKRKQRIAESLKKNNPK